MRTLLEKINLLGGWSMPCHFWGFSFKAITFDRLLNLWLHKLGFMGVEEKVFFGKYISEGMNVLDVGGNQGIYACLFARLVGAEGKVLSLEPDPRLFDCLQGNIERNQLSWITAMPLGLSDKPTEGRLARGLFNSGDNRLSQEFSDTSSSLVDVQLVDGDSLLEGQKVDFIKIDVQGWEPLVIAGLKKTFEANPHVVVYLEYWPFGLQEAGFSPDEFIQDLLDTDFAMQICEKDQLRDITSLGDLSDIRGKKFTNLLLKKRASDAVEE